MEQKESGIDPEHIRPDELRPLLELLHDFGDQEIPEREHKLTVGAVCEATGRSFQDVAAALDDLRRAKLSHLLREMEESTHRVERAAPYSKDPLGWASPLARMQLKNSVLDDLKRVDVVIVKHEDSAAAAEKERKQQRQNMIVALIMFGVLLLALLIPLAMNRS